MIFLKFRIISVYEKKLIFLEFFPGKSICFGYNPIPVTKKIFIFVE